MRVNAVPHLQKFGGRSAVVYRFLLIATEESKDLQ